MPEQTDIPISSFPDAESISNADKVTGIKNNLNTNFTFSSILSWFVNAVKSAFVPVSRTVNGKTLDTNISLSASDVGARPNTWIPTATQVGAIPASEKGVPLGVPVLDIDGKIPGNQLDLEDKANQAQLAVVESGSTASVDHAVNTYFCWNGLLYRATAKISTGQSFTPGTNCEAVTAGGELLDRCRTMTVKVTKGKSVDVLVVGSSNYTPNHGFILIATGNQKDRMMGVWLCFGLGPRHNYHVIQPLHTSGATSLSLTSTVDGKYTFTNSDSTYDCYITVAVLQETGDGDRYLSLSAPY